MRANIESLRNIFSQMKDDGVDTEKPHIWSFFFFDKSKQKILKLKSYFENESINISQMNDGYWRLSLTRKTIYTLEQLHLQNTKFNKLSIEKGIEIYDGWDIEPTT